MKTFIVSCALLLICALNVACSFSPEEVADFRKNDPFEIVHERALVTAVNGEPGALIEQTYREKSTGVCYRFSQLDSPEL